MEYHFNYVRLRGTVAKIHSGSKIDLRIEQTYIPVVTKETLQLGQEITVIGHVCRKNNRVMIEADNCRVQ